jgi:hypothetical protein
MTDWKARKHTMAWWDGLYTTLVQAAKDADDTPGVSVIDESFDLEPEKKTCKGGVTKNASDSD